MPALSQEKLYTIDDIYNLKDGERAELVDGHIICHLLTQNIREY